MPTYNTPGVYVEEISTLPASVAPVATAIPAFIGYTEKAKKSAAADLHLVPTRITSMLEYEQYFGGPQSAKSNSIDVTLDENSSISGIAFDLSKFVLHYSLKHYFANGGGPCYIVSVNKYDSLVNVTASALVTGIAPLKKADEPTLLVFPDIINLQSADKANTVYDAALAHCVQMQDRFVIMDVTADDTQTVKDDGDDFRSDGVSSNNLKYGAAYYPPLLTSIPYVTAPTGAITFAQADIDRNQDGDVADSGEDTPYIDGVTLAQANDLLAITAYDGSAITALSLPTALDTYIIDDTTLGVAQAEISGILTEDFLRDMNSQIEALAISKGHGILGPSSAMAGIYATVDRTRGVWKAPANVSVAGVIKPTVKITDADQESLNVDATSGKSINAIRTFTGKGTLVWGARTLAGNDNEWRYVPVRRLFIMAEESIAKASEFVVFEPNDANTWVKVKVMIENFLNGLWKDGALAGATPEAAYFVNVGLGSTMTAQDILEGKLIIEVGMAAVRPAEFVILRFMHKLQES